MLKLSQLDQRQAGKARRALENGKRVFALPKTNDNREAIGGYEMRYLDPHSASWHLFNNGIRKSQYWQEVIEG
jgi:hypothetical protein